MRLAALVIAAAIAPVSVAGADELFELAKKVANPLADLATAPLLYNWDGRLGSDEQGTSNYVRFQPVLPLHVDQDWNVISRLFMPIVEQDDVSPGSGTDFGLTGVNLSFFVSPRGPVSRGLTVGLGPVIGFPATNSALGSQKWGLGPRRRSFGNRRGHGPRAFSPATSGRWGATCVRPISTRRTSSRS